MHHSTCTQPTLLPLAPTLLPDLFSKYLTGIGVKQMPFKLFERDCSTKKNKKKCGARGPYRRYTSEEKLEIIQRVFLGVI